MANFFKKIKSRSNSGSYHPDEDESYERVNTHDAQAPPSSYRDPVQSPQLEGSQSDSRMYSSRSSQDGYNSQRPMTTRDSGFVDSNNTPQHNMPAQATPSKPMAAPDLLTAAFNAAIKPYTDEIAELKAHLGSMQHQLDMMGKERGVFINWIDKRGLRAGKPVLSFGYIELLISCRCTKRDRGYHRHWRRSGRLTVLPAGSQDYHRQLRPSSLTRRHERQYLLSPLCKHYGQVHTRHSKNGRPS